MDTELRPDIGLGSTASTFCDHICYTYCLSDTFTRLPTQFHNTNMPASTISLVSPTEVSALEEYIHLRLGPRTYQFQLAHYAQCVHHTYSIMWYIDSRTTATTDTHGSNELRTNVGDVWALEYCVVTGILTTTDYYTFMTSD